MKLQGRKMSSNVEDRRGLSSGTKVAAGGGIVAVIIGIVLSLLGGGSGGSGVGIDLGQIIGAITQGGNGGFGDILSGKPAEATYEGGTDPSQFSLEEQRLDTVCRVILGSTEEVWSKVFKENGWGEYRKPTLVLFTNSVQSNCGHATSSVGPFYCRGDEKLYIDLSFFTEMKRQLGVQGNDFAYAYVIAHEIGHHVEYLRGILTKDYRYMRETDNQTSVRMELLADYYAGVWAYHEDKAHKSLEDGDIDRAIELAQKIGDDWLQRQAQGRVVEESFTHGTSAQRKRWLKKGLDTGDMRTTTFNVRYSDL